MTINITTVKKMKKRNELLVIVLSVIFFALFAVILKIGGFGTSFMVNMNNYFLKATIQSGGMSTTDALGFLVQPFLLAFIAILFMTLALSLISSYGYYKINNLGLKVGVPSSIIVFLIFGFSVLSFFTAIGILIACYFIMPLSNTYGKELKKWTFFRTGSNSISKALMIIEILVVIGIFISSLSALPFYKQSLRTELKQTIYNITISSLPVMDDSISLQIDSKVSQIVDDSPIFNAYFTWLPVIAALTVLFFMEFLRGFVFSNIGGLFTSLFIRLFSG